jgi:hypothetical protein
MERVLQRTGLGVQGSGDAMTVLNQVAKNIVPRDHVAFFDSLARGLDSLGQAKNSKTEDVRQNHMELAHNELQKAATQGVAVPDEVVSGLPATRWKALSFIGLAAVYAARSEEENFAYIMGRAKSLDPQIYEWFIGAEDQTKKLVSLLRDSTTSTSTSDPEVSAPQDTSRDVGNQPQISTSLASDSTASKSTSDAAVSPPQDASRDANNQPQTPTSLHSATTSSKASSDAPVAPHGGSGGEKKTNNWLRWVLPLGLVFVILGVVTNLSTPLSPTIDQIIDKLDVRYLPPSGSGRGATSLFHLGDESISIRYVNVGSSPTGIYVRNAGTRPIRVHYQAASSFFYCQQGAKTQASCTGSFYVLPIDPSSDGARNPNLGCNDDQNSVIDTSETPDIEWQIWVLPAPVPWASC